MVSHLDFNKYYQEYIIKLQSSLENVDIDKMKGFIEILDEARKNKKRIFFIGNGGSAATASHFVNDLSFGTGMPSPPYNAISLCDNTSILTALSNDYSFSDIFTMQLNNLASKGDVLVCISASGDSENIINAARFAKDNSLLVVGISAFDGGRLLGMSDCSIHIQTNKNEYGLSEDIHMIIDHVLTSFLKLIHG